jgi:GNAT superfamily N-acetyltransferase
MTLTFPDTDQPIRYELIDVDDDQQLNCWLDDPNTEPILASTLRFKLDDITTPPILRGRYIWTHPDYTNRGYAKQALRRLIEAAHAAGAAQAIGTQLDNPSALILRGIDAIDESTVVFTFDPPDTFTRWLLDQTVA